jgi:two-component system NarL family sensor kinase
MVPAAMPDNSSTPDATLQTLHERALLASEDRFATAFYSSPIAMAITTVAEGRYIDVNHSFERQMGYAGREVCGRTSLELNVWITPAERAAMVDALQRQRIVRDQHAQFRTKSGRLITTLYSAGLISLDGQPCILAAIADITAQKAAEDALRESEAKFRLLAETMLIGVFIYREDGAFCYCNPQVEAFTGYSAEEIRSMAVWDIVHPDSKDVIRARVRARFRGEPVPPRSEVKIITKAGAMRWIDLSGRLIEFQREPAVLGSAVDVTETKRNELQLKEHTALLQTLVANSPFGIVVGGKDHRLRFCNAAFERMFLYANDDVVGKDPDELVGLPQNEEATDISDRVRSGEIVHATTVRRRKDGRLINVELHAIPLIDDGEFIGCFGMYQDITERVSSEAKLRTLRGRLTRVQDEERAHIARELHDNIGQRLALLGLQLAELRTAAAAVPDLAERLEVSTSLTEDITTDVERLSRRMHPSQLTYLGLTKALSGLCKEFARQHGMTIDFDHEEMPKLPPDISTCIYRVVQEALRNAERHSGSRHVRVELVARPEVIELRVSDEGRGFDTTIADEAGLGLVSMTERVRGVGGDLFIRSAIGSGTHIHVSIPSPRSATSISTAI